MVFTLLVLLFFLEILKKKALKKKALKKISSENFQISSENFQSFFSFFSRPLDPKSEKKIPINQLIKQFWPKLHCNLL